MRYAVYRDVADLTGTPQFAIRQIDLVQLALNDPEFTAWWNTQDPAIRDDLQPHPVAPSPLPQNVQNAIAAFRQFKQATTAQQNALTGAQLAGLLNGIIDSLAYLNSRIS